MVGNVWKALKRHWGLLLLKRRESFAFGPTKVCVLKGHGTAWPPPKKGFIAWDMTNYSHWEFSLKNCLLNR